MAVERVNAQCHKRVDGSSSAGQTRRNDSGLQPSSANGAGRKGPRVVQAAREEAQGVRDREERRAVVGEVEQRDG